MVAALAVEGAFPNPVLGAQAVFRAVMNAMARPGSTMPVDAGARPPKPLAASAGAVALALLDHDAPAWLDPMLAEAGAPAAWLAFHTGVTVVRNPADAHFALVANPAEFIALENFAQGSQEYPDRSTTIVFQVDTLRGGPRLRLTGPGVDGSARCEAGPLPRHFVEQWRQNRARFPRGVDLILAGPDAVIGLPRTVTIEAEG